MRIVTKKHIQTQAQDISKYEVYDKNRSEDKIIKEETVFIGELGGQFKTIFSEYDVIGGEAEIYMCHKNDDDRNYIMKIYTSGSHTPSSGNDRKRNKIIEFLLENNQNDESCIMPLVDYGRIELEHETYKTYYYVDVYPFCEKGDLSRSGKISYENLFNCVIPCVNKALNTFHSAGLVHRDIKPENLYWFEDKVVVGDFGITSSAEEEISHMTVTRRGTLGYSAPELAQGAAAFESDYYSFGQTIATLYMGRHMYSDLIENNTSPDQKDVNRRALSDFIMREKIFLDIESESHQWLEVLIKGLLTYGTKNRFRFHEVNQWLEKDLDLKSKLAASSRTKTNMSVYERPFKFKGKMCTNNEALDIEMNNDWRNALAFFWRGTIKAFFDREDATLALHADDIINSTPPLDENVGLSRFLHYLNKGNGICWKGTRYKNYAEISDKISIEDGVNQDIYDLIVSGILSWRLVNSHTQIDESNIKALIEVENVTKKHKEIGYYYAKYKLAKNKKLNRYREYGTLSDLLDKIFKNPKILYEDNVMWLDDPIFYAFIASQGYKDVALKIFNETRGINRLKKLQKIFRFFEIAIEEESVTKLRKLYIERGPRSYMYWFQNNLKLYDFNGPSAKLIKKEISSIKMSENNSLSEIDEAFNSIEHLMRRFMEKFHNNIFLFQAGILEGKDIDGITTNKLMGYFLYDFYGESVPVGYKRHIGGEDGL